jgi:hypothetical protein
MNITKLNFKYLCPKISNILKRCDHLSIDLEFSGISSHKELINSRHDDNELRYFKIKQNIKNFIPLQLGLCAMENKREKVILHPMNFFIFPFSNETLFFNKKYLFDISSINFLVSNNFDFNKTFYDGIRFLSIHESKNLKIEQNKKLENNKLREEKNFPPEARIFFMTLYTKIIEFKEKFKNQSLDYDHPENVLQIEVTYVRKLFIDYLIKNISTLNEDNIIFTVELDDSNILNTMMNIKIANKDILSEKINKMINEKNFRKLESWLYYQNLSLGESNQRNIWKDIILNIIFSLGKIDLNNADYIEKLEEIATNSSEYSYEEITNIFKTNKSNPLVKCLIQTLMSLDADADIGFSKLILEIIQQRKPLIFHNGLIDLCQIIDKFVEPLPETLKEFTNVVNNYFPNIYDTKFILENNATFYNVFPKTSLEEVYNKIHSDQLIASELIQVIGYEKADRSYSHEAGYDAMMTAYVYTFINKYLFRSGIECKYIELFRNKMMFSNLQIVCDLDPKNYNENLVKRYDIYVITELPDVISVGDIVESFNCKYGLKPVVNKLFGQNVAYAIITNSNEMEMLKNVVENSEIDCFEIEKYNKKVNVMSYRKYITILKESFSIEGNENKDK